MDDRQIIELYHKRDEKAIFETSSKYGKYCFSIANNILCDRQDSEECVNDTWLKTWNSIPPQLPSNFKLYLGRIVRNISFNKYKEKNAAKRGGHDLTLALEEIDEFIADVSEVESEADERALMEAINRFLRSLKDRECSIFIRRYFHAFSIGRIASMYDMTESAVSKTLARTREKLKKFLRSEGYIV